MSVCPLSQSLEKTAAISGYPDQGKRHSAAEWGASDWDESAAPRSHCHGNFKIFSLQSDGYVFQSDGYVISGPNTFLFRF